jgi:type IV pilus assembly protein PilA
MITAIRERLARSREDRGFTLIELMVVVLIIAILIAIAIPTFLGARKRAQDRAVQTNIRNAFVAEKTFYTDNSVYTETPADLTAIEPALTYVTNLTPALASNTVYVKVVGTTIYVSAKSATGTCFYLKDDASSATSYAKDAACAAANGPPAGGYVSSW